MTLPKQVRGTNCSLHPSDVGLGIQADTAVIQEASSKKVCDDTETIRAAPQLTEEFVLQVKSEVI